MEPYYQSALGSLYHGDCLAVMETFSDNHIDLTVTSPPYDNLRDYKGYPFDFESTAKELYRITKKGGVVVWVVGDATINGSETGTSFKQALYFMKCGFNLHDTMIYKAHKMPLSHNRYEQEFEYMFVLSKGVPKTVNHIKIACENPGGIRKNGKSSRQDSEELNTERRWSRNPTKEKKIKGNIWFYDTGGSKSTKDKIAFQHPAIFPDKLATDHIISWSNENDLVFDPFSGSGTTAQQSEYLKRRWVVSEISQDYCKICKTRIEYAANQMSF